MSGVRKKVQRDIMERVLIFFFFEEAVGITQSVESAIGQDSWKDGGH